MQAPPGNGRANNRPLKTRLAAVLAPVLIFYAGLLLSARNLPLLDDYDAGLNFSNELLARHGLRERLIYFAAAQHNEYKLFLAHTLVWLQLTLTGHINFWTLSLLGNASLLLLGAVLWRMFLPGVEPGRRLALFIPVPLLLFQYQYVETLNWPLPGLQTLPVEAFAIGSLYLLEKVGWPAFGGALLAMALGISASGNGFLIVVAGALLLLLRRRWAPLLLWLAAAAALAWAYAFHYKAPVEGAGHQSALTLLLHPHVTYLLGFLGAAGRYPFAAGAVLLGAALCLLFAWTIRQGFLRDQPTVGYCLLFILLTGVGIAGLRAEDGLAQSVSSRYRMYSDLLLVFAWFALVWRLRLDRAASLGGNRVYLAAVTLSALFCLTMDAIGARTLLIRDRNLVRGMTAYEQSGGTQTPIYAEDPRFKPLPAYAEHARQVLRQSEAIGIYHPPIF